MEYRVMATYEGKEFCALKTDWEYEAEMYAEYNVSQYASNVYVLEVEEQKEESIMNLGTLENLELLSDEALLEVLSDEELKEYADKLIKLNTEIGNIDVIELKNSGELSFEEAIELTDKLIELSKKLGDKLYCVIEETRARLK